MSAFAAFILAWFNLEPNKALTPPPTKFKTPLANPPKIGTLPRASPTPLTMLPALDSSPLDRSYPPNYPNPAAAPLSIPSGPPIAPLIREPNPPPPEPEAMVPSFASSKLGVGA